MGPTAMSYAAQVEQDFELFTRAIAEGRLSSHDSVPDGQGAAAASNLAAPPPQDAVADAVGADTRFRNT